MNILKKMAALATAGLTAAVLFTGCSGESKVVGKWDCTKIKTGDTEVTAEDYAELVGGDLEIGLEFKEDGTVSVNLFGEKEDEEYDTDSDDVLVDEDGTKLRYDEDSDTVILEDSESTITFERAK